MVVYFLLSSKNSLYILDNIPLLDASFANIFSLCGLSSHAIDSVFHRAETLFLMKCSLSIIFFMDHAFDVSSKSLSPYYRRHLSQAKHSLSSDIRPKGSNSHPLQEVLCHLVWSLNQNAEYTLRLYHGLSLTKLDLLELWDISCSSPEHGADKNQLWCIALFFLHTSRPSRGSHTL